MQLCWQLQSAVQQFNLLLFTIMALATVCAVLSASLAYHYQDHWDDPYYTLCACDDNSRNLHDSMSVCTQQQS